MAAAGKENAGYCGHGVTAVVHSGTDRLLCLVRMAMEGARAFNTCCHHWIGKAQHLPVHEYINRPTLLKMPLQPGHFPW